jgi:hypothetical protein
MPKSEVQPPSSTVEYHTKGKKPISWRRDTTILLRLVSVAEIYLRGGNLLNISHAFGYSLSTAKRDLARVKTLWREQALADLADLRAESLAHFRLIITRAWADYNKKPSPHWLRVIMDAQEKIDNIYGNQASKRVEVTELDIEAIRQKRWYDKEEMMQALLEDENNNSNAEENDDLSQ